MMGLGANCRVISQGETERRAARYDFPDAELCNANNELIYISYSPVSEHGTR